MCILFIYSGKNDGSSDYNLILASNRDEFYDRPAQNMASWKEDPSVIGGRDLEAGCEQGTWLAVSSLRKKIGVLLNLPTDKKQNAKSRGKIVADFVKSNKSVDSHIDSMKNYLKECNDFVFVAVEFSKSDVDVYTYCNATNQLEIWSDSYLGFSNSLPTKPLKKAEGGKNKLRDICKKLNKASMKAQLTEELVNFLKSDERYLPDPELENRRPEIYQELSSIFVSVPKIRYGTRTHTIMLVTKTGHVDLIEISLQASHDLLNPKWVTSQFEFDI